MVSPITKIPTISGPFPKANKAITDFIDTLVSLEINPNEGFAKNLNDFFIGLDNGYYESLAVFRNTEFPKILTLSCLINVAIQSFQLVSSENDQNLDPFIAAAFGFISSPNELSYQEFTQRISQYRNGEDRTSMFLDYILRELERRKELERCNVPDVLQTIYDCYKNPENLEEIDNSSKLDFTHDELLGEDISEDDIRKSANSFQRNFKAIMGVDHLINGDELDSAFLIPTQQFDSIAKNKNIIPAFKILNLRPLVRDLNGLMNCAEDDVMKQIATALNIKLASKAPSDQLDNYKKLALAVFPRDVAGRLRAAGFAPTASKA